MLERERHMEGEWVSMRESATVNAEKPAVNTSADVVPKVAAVEEPAVQPRRKGGFWRGVFTFLFGVAATIAALAIAAWYVAPDLFT